MANFTAIDKVIISTEFPFGNIVPGVINSVECSDGKIAGWKLTEILNENQETVDIIQIYDGSTGDNILMGSLYSVPGADLLGGLFSTGILPSKNVRDIDCKFYKVEYDNISET